MDRSIYDAMAAQDNVHWWYVARRDVLTDLIARYIPLPADARILEIGCGTGHNLEMLAKFGTVEGSELDPASRAMAIERFGPVIGDARLPELEGITASGLRHEQLTSFNSLLFPLAAASRIAAKVRGREGSDDSMPAAPVNSLFRMIFGLERHLIGRVPLPPGVSLAAILSPR
jgi:SAM-dependent methyltransferase